MPGDFLTVRPLNWDEIIYKYDDDNAYGKGEENTPGGEKGTGKGIGANGIEGERKGKGNRNSTGKGNVEQTPEGDNISCAVALQLQKERYEADSDTEG